MYHTDSDLPTQPIGVKVPLMAAASGNTGHGKKQLKKNALAARSAGQRMGDVSEVSSEMQCIREYSVYKST